MTGPDSLKNHVLGWLMGRIRLTPQKYVAVDHKPSGFNALKASWRAKPCNGIGGQAHESMHDVEFIRLAVMFAASLHVARITH